ncbi:hypothetical protein QUB05_18270 [Microcoleus sp. F10-C6]
MAIRTQTSLRILDSRRSVFLGVSAELSLEFRLNGAIALNSPD